MSDLRRCAMAARRPHRIGGSSRTSSISVQYTPIKSGQYFQKHGRTPVSDGVFHFYTRGNTTGGPLIVALHGGGYSALTWCLFAKDILTKIEARILAIDLRGHGSTETDHDDNLSIEQLAKDVHDVISSLFENQKVPPIILIGHSMGGAIAVETAPLLPTLAGVCIIDVVEGTALESLSAMQNILRGRPSSFPSIEHAVQWGFHGGTTRNLEAARVSMPGQIKNKITGKLASEEVEDLEMAPIDRIVPFKIPHYSHSNSIVEEDDDPDRAPSSPGPSSSEKGSEIPDDVPEPKPAAESGKYVWRIDLSKTETFWSGWFKGLSAKFLNISAPKILVLANIHGLDTTLTVGQMQGKFQLQVLPKSGHAIHEDQPEAVADIIATYLVRQRLAKATTGFMPMTPGS